LREYFSLEDPRLKIIIQGNSLRSLLVTMSILESLSNDLRSRHMLLQDHSAGSLVASHPGQLENVPAPTLPFLPAISMIVRHV
jgi:hypothetical protein